MIVISGYSGSGKGTALDSIGERIPELKRIATYTTRPMRDDEENGKNYNFVSTQEFKSLLKEGEIVETVRPYKDHSYGSPKLFLEDDGKDIVVEMNHQGFTFFKDRSERKIIGIFIQANRDELEDRITDRHPERNLQARMSNSDRMKDFSELYDYVVTNDSIEEFEKEILEIVQAELRSANV